MFLVLCDSHDHSALWLADGMRHRGLDVTVVFTKDLLRARRLVMRLDDRETRWEIELEDGRGLLSSDVSGAVNRLGHLPGDFWFAVSSADQSYGAQEWHALLLALLAAIPGPVLNPPSPQWLAGPWRYGVQWNLSARQAGFDVEHARWPEMREASQAGGDPVSALVIDEYAWAPDLTAEERRRCIGLAHHIGCPMLQLSFLRRGDALRFLTATAFVDFRSAGEGSIEAVLACLRKCGGIPQ